MRPQTFEAHDMLHRVRYRNKERDRLPCACTCFRVRAEVSTQKRTTCHDDVLNHCTPLNVLVVFQHFSLSKSLKDSVFHSVSCKYKKKKIEEAENTMKAFFSVVFY